MNKKSESIYYHQVFCLLIYTIIRYTLALLHIYAASLLKHIIFSSGKIYIFFMLKQKGGIIKQRTHFHHFQSGQKGSAMARNDKITRR
jgi:hypothetical protein